MGWIFREKNIHKCALPVYDARGAKVGDIWQCDEPTCKRKWRVKKINYDQRDGDYLSFERYVPTQYPPRRD